MRSLENAAVLKPWEHLVCVFACWAHATMTVRAMDRMASMPSPPTAADAPPVPPAPPVSATRPEDAVPGPLATDETCAACRFYCGANAQAGECRRFAPILAEESSRAAFPILAGKNWCGEFVPAVIPTTH